MTQGGSDTKSDQTTESAPLDTKAVAASLQRADILLTRGGGLTSRLIRTFTQSYWNHVAIVFVLSDTATGTPQGYQRTFILEAEPHGVDAHPIDKYLCNEKQDMVILRFPNSALPPSRVEDFQRRVRGFAFEEIDAKYGYGTLLRIAERLLGPVGWLLKPVVRAVRMVGSRRKAINDFICSGVVQHAYYRACFGAVPARDPLWDAHFQDAENRGRLVVNPEMRAVLSAESGFSTAAEQLKLTTPADFSRAAEAGQLECVAQRIDRDWGRQLTKV